mmetsp:Transcript_106124/g.199812  ORF Transcript_106124/g.199812 Transcript_106124/m.199812 type:complete len:200 (-) Transcript_106124:1602-2201(-)
MFVMLLINHEENVSKATSSEEINLLQIFQVHINPPIDIGKLALLCNPCVDTLFGISHEEVLQRFRHALTCCLSKERVVLLLLCFWNLTKDQLLDKFPVESQACHTLRTSVHIHLATIIALQQGPLAEVACTFHFHLLLVVFVRVQDAMAPMDHVPKLGLSGRTLCENTLMRLELDDPICLSCKFPALRLQERSEHINLV